MIQEPMNQEIDNPDNCTQATPFSKLSSLCKSYQRKNIRSEKTKESRCQEEDI